MSCLIKVTSLSNCSARKPHIENIEENENDALPTWASAKVLSCSKNCFASLWHSRSVFGMDSVTTIETAFFNCHHEQCNIELEPCPFSQSTSLLATKKQSTLWKSSITLTLSNTFNIFNAFESQYQARTAREFAVSVWSSLRSPPGELLKRWREARGSGGKSQKNGDKVEKNPLPKRVMPAALKAKKWKPKQAEIRTNLSYVKMVCLMRVPRWAFVRTSKVMQHSWRGSNSLIRLTSVKPSLASY